MLSAKAQISLFATFLLVGGHLAMADAGFHAVTLVDMKNPVPASWLSGAGVDYVYVSAPMGTDKGEGGALRVPKSLRAGWEKLEKAYGEAGVKVLIMSNYYSRNPDGTDAVDVSGRTIEMACLHSDAFYQWMASRIVDQASAYSEFSVFGGFVFDDGWGTRVDCCYCDVCKALFKQRCGKAPPPFEVHDGTGVVADDDVLLQWEGFQRAAYDRYVKVQAEAVRSVSDKLMMLTIPSDSFFYGRLLTANLPREALARSASALIQRLERLQVKHWRLYQSFPMPRLPEAGETGLQPWGVGEHFTSNSPKLVLCTEGPFLQHPSRVQMMGPQEVEQMAKITITEGANALCYWASGSLTAYHPDGFDGMAAAYADVVKIRDVLDRRAPYPAQVGVLYSTTTEVMEQPWRKNLSERWVHLHSFEATLWSLLRGNVWRRVVMEDEIAAGALSGLRVLIAPSVRFLCKSAHAAIERAAAQGLTVVVAGDSVPIKGAVRVEHEVTFWHRCIRSGYRTIRNLNKHYADAEQRLVPLVRQRLEYPVQASSPMGISKLYSVGDELVLMIANWDLHEPTPAELTAAKAFSVTDALTGQDLGELSRERRLSLSVPAAGWRVLRLR